MELVEPGKLLDADSLGVDRLGKRDLDEMQALYDASYPGHWFSAAMLDNGPYVGLRDEAGELLSIAGVHVYSESYAVAALGNIVTHPELRGRGFGKRATAGLCQALLPGVKTIALNVQAENDAANKLYAGLGFQAIADYGEYMLVSSG
jgi:ribosomal protein S18 acetylase RimI-like enzyme